MLGDMLGDGCMELVVAGAARPGGPGGPAGVLTRVDKRRPGTGLAWNSISKDPRARGTRRGRPLSLKN